MIRCVAALALFLSAAQEGAREWIEKLSSERAEVRDEAARKLKELGTAALPELEKAANAGDAETAARARAILRAIGLRSELTPAVLRAFPGVEDRLASGDANAWTLLFLQCTRLPEERKPEDPVFERADLKPLAVRALRGCRSNEEKVAISRLVSHYRFRATIPELVPLLKESDRLVVLMAMNSLSEFRASEAVPEILSIARQQSTGDRSMHAARALCALRAPEGAKEILGLFRTPFHFALREAAEASGELGLREAVPSLVPLLRHDDAFVRVAAARALSELGAADAAPALAGLLQDRDPLAREAAAESLGRLGAKGEIPALAAVLRAEESGVKAKAAEALGLLGARPQARDLLALLREGDLVAPSAAAALIQMGATELAADVHALALNESSNPELVGEVLVHLGADAGLPQLLKRVKDPEGQVRQHAVRILRVLRSRGGVPALLSSLNDPEDEIAAEAAIALGELGLKEAAPRIQARLAKFPGGRPQYMEALGLLAAKAAIPPIRKALRDEDARDVGIAAEALGRLGDRESAADLRRLLQKQLPLRTEKIIGALVALDARDAIPMFVDLLEADFPTMRTAAADALCAMGRREGIPILLAERRSLESLHWLRSPELWATLDRKVLTKDLKGPQGDIAGALAKEAGLTLEESSVSSGLYPSWKARLRRIRAPGGSLSVRRALAELFDGDFTFVIDKDRLRILSTMQAVELWRAWERESRPR